MKLDPANPIELRFWCDTFLAHVSDGPVAAGRDADLAVETMRERMPAPREEPTPDVRVRERAATQDFEQVTAERLHVAPGWVSSAAGIRKAIDGAADRGDVIVVDIRVDDENVAQWVLGVPEQAEALVAALLSAGVQA